MELTHFTFNVDDGVAVVLLDRAGEPMNTIGPVIFEEFSAVIDRIETDPVIKAAVIGSAKKGNFLAGADIRFFETLTDPDEAADAIRELHALFVRIEALHAVHDKPVVMAIDGACLGGGLELALTGSMRIATDGKKTQLGQPEVQLGILPAGGGTQRLPKVIGIAAALDMILTGRPARPHKALKIGLVDEVVPREMLYEIASKRAIESIGKLGESRGAAVKGFLAPSHLQALAVEQNPVGRRVMFKKAEEAMLAKTKGLYPAPKRALEAVKIGVEQGNAAGYEAEATFFGELVTSPESKALRGIFFASQMMKYSTGISGHADPKKVSKVGILGGGLMGAGIATVSVLKAGATARVREVDEAGIGRALSHVSREISKQVKRRRLTPFEGEQAMNKVTGTTNWNGFQNADIVIEAVFESLDLKQALLAEAEDVIGADVVFASNTSSLPIADIAADAKRPELVLGMHYFSPVEKMPLLEIIVTENTSDAATVTAVEFGKRQGKTVIVVKDGPGFYTTRILVPYLNEAFFLLSEGASVKAIDKAMTKWGFPIGPLLLTDEVGIDVGAHISKIMFDAFGERMAGPEMAQGLLDDDRQGRKNGRGFYEYDDKGARGGVDESVYQALGLGPRREIPKAEIQERIALAMVNEAARCLEEGILQSAVDGDMGAVMGLGFPPFRGGPFWWMDEIGAGEIVANLEALAEKHGERFEPAAIIRTHAESEKKFR
ncbi:MAG: fatty acid oxidation complex subunit alpha FadJ [Actinomycetota bacterium]|nr:fatty acid oxidation complex subunit alpha FadJ [Actinomycetota bacterium]